MRLESASALVGSSSSDGELTLHHEVDLQGAESLLSEITADMRDVDKMLQNKTGVRTRSLITFFKFYNLMNLGCYRCG